jgi:hypothetical protein
MEGRSRREKEERLLCCESQEMLHDPISAISLHGMQIVLGGDLVDRLGSARGFQGHPGLELRAKVPSRFLLHGSRSESAENAPTLKPQIQSSPWLRPPGPPLY